MYVLNICYINILPILSALENECDLRKIECNKNLNFLGHDDIISDMMLVRQELNDTEKKFDGLNHRRQVLSKVSELILNDVSSQITNIHTALVICCCYRTVPSAIWEIFSEFLIFCNVTAKYEKRGKYLPILHEEKFDNYFIVKMLELSHILTESVLLNII